MIHYLHCTLLDPIDGCKGDVGGGVQRRRAVPPAAVRLYSHYLLRLRGREGVGSGT